jgi:glycosyltransferase involved in cell wall biosynthesis
MTPSLNNARHRLLMILQDDFPPDIRLEKEIKSLQDRFDVYLLCNNKGALALTENYSGATVIRLNKLTWLPRKLRILYNMPLFFSPVWLLGIFKNAKKYNVEALHVHDLPLAMAAIQVGKLLRLPVVYDMHENYPAVMKIWLKDHRLNFIFKNPMVAKILDSICMRRADHLIAVIDERKDQLVRRGVPVDKIHIVSNTIDLEAFYQYNIDEKIVQEYEDFYTLMYIGFFSSERGLDTAIRGLALVKNDIPNIKLVLVGAGKDRELLMHLAQNNGVEENIDIKPWVNFSRVPSYIQAGDICIDPRPSNEPNDTTISHKIFQYMAMGKPLLTSDSKPFARILSEYRCGETFKSNSPEAFAQGVLKIYQSDTNYGENGMRAVKEKYNWRHTGNILLNLYDHIFQRGPK